MSCGNECVPLPYSSKELATSGPWDRVWDFRLCRTLIQIANRGAPGIEPLFQPTVQTFFHFVTEIPAVVGRHDCLNVGREPACGGLQINAFSSEMDFHAGINKLPNIIPVLKVPRAPVNFVDHDAMRDAEPQKLQHLVESGTAFL
jgi:hypothetical protein